jgi:hypothetical protein
LVTQGKLGKNPVSLSEVKESRNRVFYEILGYTG